MTLMLCQRHPAAASIALLAVLALCHCSSDRPKESGDGLPLCEASDNNFSTPIYDSNVPPTECAPLDLRAPSRLVAPTYSGQLESGEWVVVEGVKFPLPFLLHVISDAGVQTTVADSVVAESSGEGSKVAFALEKPVAGADMGVLTVDSHGNGSVALNHVGSDAISRQLAPRNCESPPVEAIRDVPALELKMRLESSASGLLVEVYYPTSPIFPSLFRENLPVFFLGTSESMSMVEILHVIHPSRRSVEAQLRDALGTEFEFSGSCDTGGDCTGEISSPSTGTLPLLPSPDAAHRHMCSIHWEEHI